MDVQVVGVDYFEALGIPILRGRAFTEADDRSHLRGTTNENNWAAGLTRIVVDDEFARRYWPGQDPIGKRVILDWSERPVMEIIGVVGRVKLNNLDEKAPNVRIYFPYRQFPLSSLAVVMKTAAEPEGLVQSIRREVQAIDPQQPIFGVQTLQEMRDRNLAPQRFNFMLLGFFAASALLLAIIGLYGTLAYGVAQRRREIGVRVALGAQRADVIGLVVTQGMRLAAIGVVIGLAAAAGLTRVMQRLLFGVEPLDAATFVGVTVLLTIVAFLASFIPARKAANIEPMEALRYE